MAWWQRKVEERSVPSLSDPAFAEFFGIGGLNFSGVHVGESSALTISAVWRSISLISETVASLPVKTMRVGPSGIKEQVSSFADDPGAPNMTPFEFWETTLCHLLLHGNAYLMHVVNGAGAIAGLVPVHPLAVSVELTPNAPGGKIFTASLIDGKTHDFDASTMTQIMGKSLDGIRGLSPIAVARNSLGTAIAGDRAAAKMFSNGALIAGLVTPEEDVTADEAQIIKDGLNAKLTGWENAGEIAVVNRKLKFSPWMMSAEDAQFLQSRQFQVEEVARWYGVPPFALMQTEKQTSWGTGIESQQRGLARTVLAPWTRRIEQRISTLLPSPRFIEFDFAGLERSNPTEEIRLLLEQVRGGIMTVNEARAVRNMDPVPGGDELAAPTGTAQQPAEPAGLEVVA